MYIKSKILFYKHLLAFLLTFFYFLNNYPKLKNNLLIKMRYYEIPFAVSTEIPIHGIEILRNKLLGILEAHSGKIISCEYWGMTDLAYKIKGHSRARYFILLVQAATTLPSEVKVYFNLNESIIRYEIFHEEKLNSEPSEHLKALRKNQEYLSTDEEKGYAAVFSSNSINN